MGRVARSFDRGARGASPLRSALLAVLLCSACFVREQTECDALKDDLQRCVGSRAARLDCSTVTDADVHKLRNLIEGASCELIVSALPFDGELRSATCRMFDVGCVATTTPAVEHTPARYPVLLVNGIDTSPLFRYSDRIVDALGVGGHAVFLATLTPYLPPQRRSPELWARVQEVMTETGAEKVNLICHSLGGLDCRYVASPRGLGLDIGTADIASRIASITTIGTAHRGTRAADAMLGLLPSDPDRAKTIDDFAGIAGDWFSADALQNDADVRDALHALTTVQTAAFNADVVDADGVYYQSFAGLSQPLGETSAAVDARALEACVPDEPSDAVTSSGGRDDMALPLVPLDDIVGRDGDARVPHDGLVPVVSARWGSFRGCLPADHMEQLGQRNLPDANVKTGVDIAGFYAAVAADLSKRGF